MALELMTDIDLKLLSLHWVRIDTETVAILRGDGQPLASFVAEKLVDKAWDKIAKHCANRGYKQAYLYAETEEGKPKRYPVAAELASNLQNTQPSESNLQSAELDLDSDTILTIPEQELAIGELERSALATYINAIKTQKKFYANPTALDAQGKPPEDFLTGNAYDLNDPDELDYRTSQIASGETLRNYEYQGWRWYFDGDAGRFRLKRMQFISNFRLLSSFNGVPCWLGQVLQATELTEKQLSVSHSII
jgi:PAS domain-containing protein